MAAPAHLSLQGRDVLDSLGTLLHGLLRTPRRPGASLAAAIVAVMRKLACLLNTLLREDRLWPTEPPARELAAAAWAL